ncbi:ribonucleoside-diphosphate reductase large subunit-like [Linepithema humile]|uniref:ribonucleoside-diphosphate reductase large subunit-like n=1 Tax=Linepithema humile TaxID=83485 RepID=UPI0006230756|nr:PREDICTED: ribonucleoside-diphosphate reductase large subunit-like [Linepithema humile]
MRSMKYGNRFSPDMERLRWRKHVTKRNGNIERLCFKKLFSSIRAQCYNLDMNYVDVSFISFQVSKSFYSGITTAALSDLAAKSAAALAIDHPDYDTLAVRIDVSNLHKQTKNSFSEVMRDLYYAKNPVTNKHTPIISEHYYNIIKNNAKELDSAIIYDYDFSFNYVGLKTLQNSYLLKINDAIVERPQHMWMRVAVGIHENDINSAIQTYYYLSKQYFTYASPTSFNGCLNNQQIPNCFFLTIHDNEINKYAVGVYTSSKKCGLIGKYVGTSGTFASFLEPWHADIFHFLERKKNYDNDENKRADLFDSLWIPDLFMERVHNEEMWSLMNPYESPGLADAWGDKFNKLYTKYESEGRYRMQVKARDVWTAILKSQVQTGTPYMLYKDNYSRKSNHQRVGSKNKCNNVWCTTVLDYSNPDKGDVCNLVTIAVNKFVNTENRTFDFEKLLRVTKIVTRDLDKLIDIMFCPIPDIKKFNQSHRPIGIGVQGLADAFMLMRYPFDSKEAKELNIKIFETLYFGALEASFELAEKKGTYETYHRSMIKHGIFQCDLWKVRPTNLWNWHWLRKMIDIHGVRNSLLISCMPTTSTSQILGNNESIEPYTSNIYVRRVSSEEFLVVNPHLLRDLIAQGLWNNDVKNSILSNYGSIKKIKCIPNSLKMLYKTVWEISQKVIFQMAADRGPFIDQSQSLNVHLQGPSGARLSTLYFLGWESGLKIGSYYLRTTRENLVQYIKDDKSKFQNSEFMNSEFMNPEFISNASSISSYIAYSTSSSNVSSIPSSIVSSISSSIASSIASSIVSSTQSSKYDDDDNNKRRNQLSRRKNLEAWLACSRRDFCSLYSS